MERVNRATMIIIRWRNTIVLLFSTFSRPNRFVNRPSESSTQRSGNVGEKVAILLSRRDQWLAPLLLFDYLKSDSDPLTKSALKGASSPLSSRLVRSDRPRASFVRNTSGQGSSFILRGSMNRIDFTALPLVPRRPRNAGGRGGRINCPNGGTEILESRVCVYMYVCVYWSVYVERWDGRERVEAEG